MKTDVDSLIRAESGLKSDESDLVYPLPLGFMWRIHHFMGYITGGIGFIIGSAAFIPSISNESVGAWAFTVGSAGFLFADIFEWWRNNKVGCLFDSRQRKSYEAVVARYMAESDTFKGKYERAVNGINFFVSVTGSFLYLLGSVLLIPVVNQSYEATIAYIWGSLVIFISQSWKLYRAACSNAKDPYDKTFAFGNLLSDWPATFVDFFAGIGGFAYFVGSIYFLPDYYGNGILAAIWFNMGGIFFTLSGLFMFYRYFCTLNYPH